MRATHLILLLVSFLSANLAMASPANLKDALNSLKDCYLSVNVIAPDWSLTSSATKDGLVKSASRAGFDLVADHTDQSQTIKTSDNIYDLIFKKTIVEAYGASQATTAEELENVFKEVGLKRPGSSRALIMDSLCK